MRRYSRTKAIEAHERAVRRGKLGAAANARKRLANGPQDQEPRRRDAGVWIGELQWRDESGRVRRWTAVQSKRKNQIVVAGHVKGWDWLLSTLRGHLAPLTR